MVTKDQKVNLRVSLKELQILEKAAEKCGHSLSSFVRIAAVRAATAVIK